MRRLPAPFLPLAALLALYLIAPFAAGLVNLGGADWAGTDRSTLARASLVSILSASAATVLVAIGGIPLAFILARRRSIGLSLLGFAVQLPLALPPLASGILLLFLVGYASPIGQLTGGRLTESFAGIVLAEAFVAAPFLIIAARSAFASLDPALEDVVATLGHGPAAVFRIVSLPLAWRAILSGLLLTWLRAFGEFGATVMVAYHPYSLPVYTYVAFGERGLPAMLPVLAPTLAAAVAVLALSLAARPRAKRSLPADELVAPLAAPPIMPQAPAAAAGPPLEIDVSQCYGDFELSVGWRTQARRLAVLGPSGSGKSALLRAIAGVGRGGASRVRFGDAELDRLRPEQRNIAYVPQNYGLVPHRTVARQIRLAADSDEAAASLWSERLGLGALAPRRSDELSLGQQQRVALARALARPAAGLLLLDEPFSALDAPLRARLRDDMVALQGEIDATTILVTHDPDEALLLADELLILDAGRVLQCGPAETVFVRPANEFVARLLGASTVGEGRVAADGRIDLGRGVAVAAAGPPLPPGSHVGWAIRPGQLRFGDGAYSATIAQRGPAVGGRRRIVLMLGDCRLCLPADPGCPPEGACTVGIDPEALQVWPKAPGG